MGHVSGGTLYVALWKLQAQHNSAWLAVQALLNCPCRLKWTHNVQRSKRAFSSQHKMCHFRASCFFLRDKVAVAAAARKLQNNAFTSALCSALERSCSVGSSCPTHVNSHPGSHTVHFSALIQHLVKVNTLLVGSTVCVNVELTVKCRPAV